VHVEKALCLCQVKVDLILDEVESEVHVVSTKFISYPLRLRGDFFMKYQTSPGV
jgi:hypothetical protein